jgi:DNA repair exonuclease SbcCD nuclease subunit
MKILFISDLHFHNYKPHSEIIDGVNSRLLDIAGAVKAAYYIGRENGCELCLVAGDIFHVRGYLRPSVLSFVTELLAELAMEIPTVMIPGNHDMENYSGGATAIDNLDLLDGVNVVTEPDMITINGQNIITIPYIHKMDDFKETFQRLSKKYASPETITLIHQGIDAFASDGMPETGLTPEWLMAHNEGWTFSGHYHTPSNKGSVVNIGAVCHHTFGDVGENRGCYIFDNESKKPLYYSLAEAAPSFVDVTSGTHLEEEPIKDNIIRIKAKSKAEATRLARAVKDFNPKSYVVQLEKDFKTAHEKAIKVGKPFAMLSEYIDINKKFTPHKKAILDLYEEVCNG